MYCAFTTIPTELAINEILPRGDISVLRAAILVSKAANVASTAALYKARAEEVAPRMTTTPRCIIGQTNIVMVRTRQDGYVVIRMDPRGSEFGYCVNSAVMGNFVARSKAVSYRFANADSMFSDEIRYLANVTVPPRAAWANRYYNAPDKVTELLNLTHASPAARSAALAAVYRVLMRDVSATARAEFYEACGEVDPALERS